MPDIITKVGNQADQAKAEDKSFRESNTRAGGVAVWKLEIWRHFLRKIIVEASVLRLDIKNMFQKGNSKIYNFSVDTEFKFAFKWG